jgi:hypothetical protein
VAVAEPVLVEVDGVEFYVEVADEDAGTVGLNDLFNFDGVRNTVEAIAGQMAGVWDRVKPSEACVEFGLKVTGKSGKLTGLLVEGGGDASLKVKLTWTIDKVPRVTPAT